MEVCVSAAWGGEGEYGGEGVGGEVWLVKDTNMIEIQSFNRAVNEFNKEGRTDFFKLAQKLIKSDFEIEGLLLILATWNFAKFRYAIKKFDIDHFIKTVDGLRANFNSFDGKDFASINFDAHKSDIEAIFNGLSAIKGIEYTGAPKLMHLKNPDVFVMWDSFIRGDKPKKYYQDLEVFKNGTYEYKKYQRSFEGYFTFLKDMQDKFQNLAPYLEKSSPPLAKAVDEFNYVNITLPLQEIFRTKKNRGKTNPDSTEP